MLFLKWWPNSPLLLKSPEEVFMEIRRPLEWHCKQMDHFVGLNFSANFNFALVGHLLKGKAAADRDQHLQAVIQCSVRSVCLYQ